MVWEAEGQIWTNQKKNLEIIYELWWLDVATSKSLIHMSAHFDFTYYEVLCCVHTGFLLGCIFFSWLNTNLMAGYRLDTQRAFWLAQSLQCHSDLPQCDVIILHLVPGHWGRHCFSCLNSRYRTLEIWDWSWTTMIDFVCKMLLFREDCLLSMWSLSVEHSALLCTSHAPEDFCLFRLFMAESREFAIFHSVQFIQHQTTWEFTECWN